MAELNFAASSRHIKPLSKTKRDRNRAGIVWLKMLCMWTKLCRRKTWSLFRRERIVEKGVDRFQFRITRFGSEGEKKSIANGIWLCSIQVNSIMNLFSSKSARLSRTLIDYKTVLCLVCSNEEEICCCSWNYVWTTMWLSGARFEELCTTSPSPFVRHIIRSRLGLPTKQGLAWKIRFVHTYIPQAKGDGEPGYDVGSFFSLMPCCLRSNVYERFWYKA